MSKAEKALGLCVEYVRLNDEIEQLGHDIGRALLFCPINTDEDGSTHLREYYGNVSVAYRVDGYTSAVKGEAEFLACPHCVRADTLIQIRKKARRKLGAVKSQITKLGRAAA